MKPLLVLLATMLSSCGGTVLEMDGQICGQPVKMRLADAKDRSGFTMAVTCGPDGGVTVTTADSSASAVIAAQSEALARLSAAIAAGVLP